MNSCMIGDVRPLARGRFEYCLRVCYYTWNKAFYFGNLYRYFGLSGSIWNVDCLCLVFSFGVVWVVIARVAGCSMWHRMQRAVLSERARCWAAAAR